MSHRKPVIAALFIVCISTGALRAGNPTDVAAVAAKIDALLEQHWQASGIQPAEPADNATFLRRATLDLAGRIPTPKELDQYLADKAADKQRRLVQRLVDGPEFPLHFGTVLDHMIQGEQAGNEAFVDYLRRSLRDGKTWDGLFRELMLGPWESEEAKPANRFLDKRTKALETLTADATRVFFGVDISCAKCHDHPLVTQWSQEHFYGMASFFNRTTGGKGTIGEKNEGEVKFVRTDGQEKTARMMFLSGDIIPEPEQVESQKNAFSRREQLVRVALEEKQFFSRSAVNRTWEFFFGRGLVHPVDQMHSENRPSVPDLLEWLADDFASSGYDLKRLVTAITSTRAYALSSRWQQGTLVPDAALFAVARLRPLTPQQFAVSMLVALGDGSLDNSSPLAARVQRYVGVDGLARIEARLELEDLAKTITPALDLPAADFQPSARESLFLSNNEALHELLRFKGESLVKRLASTRESREIVATAVQGLLTRAPQDDESSRLAAWLDRQGEDRRAACEQLLWALVTSAEFRFNH